MQNLVCLAYHRVSEDAADPYTVSPRAFAWQMGWLARLGWRGLGASQALRADGKVIALTFDDAYQDFADTAWPLVRETGFGATLFVVSGRAGLTANWPGGRDAPLLGWEAIAALAADGVEIGGHGVTHRSLIELADEESAAELQQTYADIARLAGAPPTALAYPYGTSNAAVAQAAQAAGFETGWTARGGRSSASTPRMALRRTLVMGADTPLRFAIKAWTGYTRFTEWKMDVRRLS